MRLTLEIPEKYQFVLSPEELIHSLKLNTAIDWYRHGHLSATAAAEFAGLLDRYEFLYECRKRKISPQTYENIEELQSEIKLLENTLP